MRVESRFRYRKIGTMTYQVYVRDDDPRRRGHGVGVVWRTRTGWSARRLDGTLTTEDYPGSRDVAAATLTRKDS